MKKSIYQMVQKMLPIFLFLFSTIFVFGQNANDRIILKSEHNTISQIAEVSVANYPIAFMDINEVNTTVSFHVSDSFNQNAEINSLIPDANNVDKNAFVPDLNFQNNQNVGIDGQKAGKGKNTAKIGFALLFVGSAAIVLPAVMNEQGSTATNIANRRKMFTTVGAIAATTGLVLIFTSLAQNRRSDKLVHLSDNLSLNQTLDGVGLVFNLK